MPNNALGFVGSGKVGLWHRTLIPADGVSGGWLQIDRGARAQVSTILCPNEQKEAYIGGEPVDDARFLGSFAHVLEQVGGYSPEEAKRVAGTMLPDILSYDPTKWVEYPVNGRALTDDAADIFFTIFTNGKITGDNVGAHTDFLPDFPYLGPPHNAYSA